ncbi:Molybdopterin binding protein [Macrolepiota fuliginosa MF-IS2]|uniref:Molybdopterin binding protein n=1 Tax=Macrolepiota fuliginosa MF-IS2 TaxID=1400762 RepID=A0A9P6C4B5_9AGAR|nr:Molybdopterin binding protein [Macrolepiota fuliginosa MF-IS2]
MSSPSSSPAATAAPTFQPSTLAPPPMKFPKSPVPDKNPLGEGRYIRTAAALIIGDEILNGKTHDRNSHVFAQYCFEHGVDLKRIEVVADVEEEIVEASKRLTEKYDFVVTSGGIGPTHDDITYESLAKSFNQPLQYHEETVHRLTEMTKHRPWVQQQNAEQRTATLRMALLPTGNDVEIIFPGEDLWVPIVRIRGRLCVLPGVPGLFQKLLHLFTPFLPLPPKSERPLRIQVYTEWVFSLPHSLYAHIYARVESLIAPYLTALQARLKPHGIQVGSYPILGQGVFISLIGRDLPNLSNKGNKTQTRIWLAEVAKEVEAEVGGKVVSEEEVALKKEKSNSSLRSAKGDADDAKAKI